MFLTEQEGERGREEEILVEWCNLCLGEFPTTTTKKGDEDEAKRGEEATAGGAELEASSSLYASLHPVQPLVSTFSSPAQDEILHHIFVRICICYSDTLSFHLPTDTYNPRACKLMDIGMNNIHTCYKYYKYDLMLKVST